MKSDFLILGTNLLPYLIAILILISISLPTLLLTGIFRAHKIAGPPRLMSGESIFTPFAILLISACCGTLAVKAFSAALHFPQDENLVVVMASVYIIVLIIAISLTMRMRPAGLRQLGLSGGQFLRAPKLMLITALAVLPLVYAAMILVQLFIELTHHKMPAVHPMLQELGNHLHSIWFVITIVEVVVLVPLAEETLFRGLLQTTLVYAIARRLDPPPGARWLGVVTVAAVFAAVHGEPAFFLPLFVLALGLGYLYERTGNLWACAMLHGFFNGLQIVMYLNISGK